MVPTGPVGGGGDHGAGHAAAQSRSLGFEPAIVWVPHPIQDRTDAELRAIADEALEEVLGALSAQE